jgi:hypothetical protein
LKTASLVGVLRLAHIGAEAKPRSNLAAVGAGGVRRPSNGRRGPDGHVHPWRGLRQASDEFLSLVRGRGVDGDDGDDGAGDHIGGIDDGPLPIRVRLLIRGDDGEMENRIAVSTSRAIWPAMWSGRKRRSHLIIGPPRAA